MYSSFIGEDQALKKILLKQIISLIIKI